MLSFTCMDVLLLLHLWTRLLKDIPAAHAKLNDTCNLIYYELGGFASFINSKLYFKLQ